MNDSKPLWFLLFLFMTGIQYAFTQSSTLQSVMNTEIRIAGTEVHTYTLLLNRNSYAEIKLLQKGADVVIDVIDPQGKKLAGFDSPNGDYGEEPVTIKAGSKGNYLLKIYKLVAETGPGTLAPADTKPGAYSIESLRILSSAGYQKKLEQEKNDKQIFGKWVKENARPLSSIDPGNGFDELAPLKTILKDVRVIGMGESTHGTSEFFRFKHRMFEFLVKEMGCTSFYLEASASRCRYINDYVLYGKGSADTATAMQGFVTWRVEEFRDLIEWIRQYNTSASEANKVTFKGFDLQINNLSWKGLKDFYGIVNQGMVNRLDSLKSQFDTAMMLANNMEKSAEGSAMLRSLYPLCIEIMTDMVMQQGQYTMLTGNAKYEENLMNIRLILQETESFKDGYNDRRDYYMAQNILYLLNSEKPGSKVMVWAHNMHIANIEGAMGHYLHKYLNDQYYGFGFEFYSGSFQSRNLDTGNNSSSWDIINVGEPPVESLPWYFEKYGKGDFFIDFRYSGANLIKNYQNTYPLHSFGSMYSKNWPITYPAYLNFFDGMIFIRYSTAARNFMKVLF